MVGEVISNEKKVYSLEGKWVDKLISIPEFGNRIPICLWKHVPSENSTMYNLTSFAMTLNELTDSLKDYLCPTDSRLRPDQRCMENGFYEKADSEKRRLEDKQRKGPKREPQWFEKQLEKNTGEYYWAYKGNYWETRETQSFIDIDLF